MRHKQIIPCEKFLNQKNMLFTLLMNAPHIVLSGCTKVWFKNLAGDRGFEPRRTVPETAVLPLDESPAITKNFTMDNY
jgi:hypothetical protein